RRGSRRWLPPRDGCLLRTAAVRPRPVLGAYATNLHDTRTVPRPAAVRRRARWGRMARRSGGRFLQNEPTQPPSGATHQAGSGPPAAPRPASLLDVALTIGITVALLGLSVFLFGSDSSAGANQIALVIGAVLAALVGVKNGHHW